MAAQAQKLESTLFVAADKLHKNIDAAEYKHIVLGLVFLKYISDSFQIAWFIRRSKTNQEILFIDAHNCGELINRKNRILAADEIQRISQTYHKWREAKDYKDIKGFCKSASLEEVATLGYTLTPGRFVGLEENEQNFDFESEFMHLRTELESQIKEEQELNQRILANLA